LRSPTTSSGSGYAFTTPYQLLTDFSFRRKWSLNAMLITHSSRSCWPRKRALNCFC